VHFKVTLLQLPRAGIRLQAPLRGGRGGEAPAQPVGGQVEGHAGLLVATVRKIPPLQQAGQGLNGGGSDVDRSRRVVISISVIG